MPTIIASVMVITCANQLTSFAVIERPRFRRSASLIATRALILVHFQGGDERLLRNVHLAELAHLLLARLLLVEQLALARDVAAVAFRGHVFAQRRERFARDHLRADRRLNR